jgi:hypothetical protein
MDIIRKIADLYNKTPRHQPSLKHYPPDNALIPISPILHPTRNTTQHPDPRGSETAPKEADPRPSRIAMAADNKRCNGAVSSCLTLTNSEPQLTPGSQNPSLSQHAEEHPLRRPLFVFPWEAASGR